MTDASTIRPRIPETLQVVAPSPRIVIGGRDPRTERGALVEDMVRQIVDGGGHRALHDVRIPTENGNGTQIDHLVVVGRSVVCLETKH